MESEIERTAAQVLNRCSAPSVSMRQLHALVVAEIGAGAGSYARFTDTLRRRRDLFVVVDPDDPLSEGPAWPPPLLDEYRQALAEAGLEAEPVVALAKSAAMPALALGAPSDASVMATLGQSLADLLDSAKHDGELERAVAHAVMHSHTMARAITAEQLNGSFSRGHAPDKGNRGG
jgi:hypothetical protein